MKAEIEACRNDPANPYFDYLDGAGILKAVSAANPQLKVQEVYNAACAAQGITDMAKTHSPRPVARNQQTATILSKMAAKHIGGSPSTSAKTTSTPESVGSTFDDVAAAARRQRGVQKPGQAPRQGLPLVIRESDREGGSPPISPRETDFVPRRVPDVASEFLSGGEGFHLFPIR